LAAKTPKRQKSGRELGFARREMCGVETARNTFSGSQRVAKLAKGEGDKIARRGDWVSRFASLRAVI